MNDWFKDQYKSDAWKKRRKQILEIDGHRCKRCGSKENLQVHHLYYRPDYLVWQYSDNELFTLCELCHQEIHHYKDQINKEITELMRRWCSSRYDNNLSSISTLLMFATHMNPMDSQFLLKMCSDTAFNIEEITL